jgi:glutamine synthetase
MASELEFYAFDDAYAGAREKHYRDLKTAGWYSEDYHVLETTKREPLMRAIRNGMERPGWRCRRARASGVPARRS